MLIFKSIIISNARYILLALLLSLALGAVIPIISVNMVDCLARLLTGQPVRYRYLITLVLVRITLEVAGFILGYFGKSRLMRDIASSLARQLISQERVFFRKTTSGKVTAAFSGVMSTLPSLCTSALRLAEMFALLLSCVVNGFFIHKEIGFLLFLSLCVWILGYFLFLSRYLNFFDKDTQSIMYCAGGISQIYDNINYIQDCSSQDFEVKKFQKMSAKTELSHKSIESINGLGVLFHSGMGTLVMFGSWYVFFLLKDSTPFAVLTQAMVVLITFSVNLPVVQPTILSTVSLFMQMKGQIENFGKDVHEKQEEFGKKTLPPGDIVISDVSFRYDDKRPALQGMTLSIKQGARVGLVGRSGNGKSTLFGLLLGYFSDRYTGTVTIGGVDIKTLNGRDLKRHFAYLHQKISLFERSIYENIAYECSWATKEDVVDAARKACIHDLIMSLPHGYDTIPLTLSGGEQQRILIARAVLRLKHADIFLADEGTSALDSESEKLVGQALNTAMEGKTSLIIAHRLGTLRALVDRIVVIDKGRVIEQGTHDDLIQKGGFYKQLWDAQVLTG